MVEQGTDFGASLVAVGGGPGTPFDSEFPAKKKVTRFISADGEHPPTAGTAYGAGCCVTIFSSAGFSLVTKRDLSLSSCGAVNRSVSSSARRLRAGSCSSAFGLRVFPPESAPWGVNG